MLKECVHCNQEFHPTRDGQIFCSSSCRGKHHRNSVGRILASKVLSRDNYKCISCGSETDLHIHHVDHSGGAKTPNNDLDNLVTLCKCCHSNLHGNKRTLDSVVFKICPICGKSFETKLGKIADGRGKYCSKECLHKSQEGRESATKGIYTTRVFLNCPICGKEFWTTQGRIDVGKDKYCSHECGYKARKQNPHQLTCKVCKNKYQIMGDVSKDYQTRYCSEECLKSERPKAIWHPRNKA